MAAPKEPATPTTPVTPTTSTETFDAIVNSGTRRTQAHRHRGNSRSDTFDRGFENGTNDTASDRYDVTSGNDGDGLPSSSGVTRDPYRRAPLFGAYMPGIRWPPSAPTSRALTYSLDRAGAADKFQVNSDGQIVLAPNHTLDYEEQWDFTP